MHILDYRSKLGLMTNSSTKYLRYLVFGLQRVADGSLQLTTPMFWESRSAPCMRSDPLPLVIVRGWGCNSVPDLVSPSNHWGGIGFIFGHFSAQFCLGHQNNL